MNAEGARRVRLILAGLAVVALGLAASVRAVQGPSPEERRRVDAFVQALTSGSAERFEAMAKEHFAPAMLERRTPDGRRQMVARLASDFGTISVTRIVAQPDGRVTLQLRGSTGLEGRVELSLDAAAGFKIASLLVQIGGGDGPEQGPAAPVRPSMTPVEMKQALDGYLGKMADAGDFAGVVLVARGGKPIYERAFGLANRDRKVPITPATRFNLASIGKIFTKTAVAQLLADGKLSLTDTVGTLLPDCPNQKARAATVEQLVGHRAGIADFFGDDFDRTPKTQFRSNHDYYTFVIDRPLTAEPGTKYQYCNGCYVVLGEIIERVTKTRYEQYIASRVFGPAGMAGAGFLQADRFPPGVGIGYTKNGAEQSADAGRPGGRPLRGVGVSADAGRPGGRPLRGVGEGAPASVPAQRVALRSNEAFHGMSGSAAGGSYASAADLLAFDNALREGRLVNAKMTAWALGGPEAAGTRARGPLGIAGGAPGANSSLESDGDWTVAVVGNLDPPNAVRVGTAIMRALRNE